MAVLAPVLRHAPRSRLILAPLVAAIAVLAVPSPWSGRAQAQEGVTGKSFVENFKTFDAKRWYVSNGWANSKYQNCIWSKDQVAVSDGVLRLRFIKKEIKNRHYACAEIQTRKRFGYGTYEATVKTVAGSGLNSAFFSYIGPAQKEPWDEIDFEALGKDPSRIQLNQYVNGKGHHEKLVAVPGGADQSFHDYAFVWEKDRLRYYIDGKLVETVTDPSRIPTHAQKIYFSLWGSDNLTAWMGPFADPGTPPVMQVKRISFTALGEHCQFPESVACSLK